MTTATCRCCAQNALEVLLDLGPQPICSHFLSEANAVAPRHPLVFARCLACGQLQLSDPAPVPLLCSPHAWLSYIEPEGHLDRLTEILCALPNAGPHWRVGGVTYKDTSTLERLRKRGWDRLWQLAPAADLDIAEGATDLALIQERLTPERARLAAEKYGRVNLLLVRHILEHVRRPAEFLAALKELIIPGGMVVFECPDAQGAFLNREYTVIWEEHLWYFTPELFARFFSHFGMRLERLRVFPFSVENSLVAFVQPHVADDSRRAASRIALESESAAMKRYALEFPRQKTAWQRSLRDGGGLVAAFGAGHTMCSFINYFELGREIRFVADDHPKKQGLFLPGSGVPIQPSALLLSGGVDQCLLGLSPESETKVLARQDAAQKQGVRFLSIFPTSERAAAVVKTATDPELDVRTMGKELPALNDAAIDTLRHTVRASSRYRNRFCAHASAEEPLHEMIVCLHAKTYVRPHRHHRKAESIHVIAGFADLVLFGEQGAIERIVRLGPPGAGLTWYVRLPRPVFHTLVLRGDDFIFQETTLGPFLREDTEMALWAPDEQDSLAAIAYKCDLIGAVLTAAVGENILS